MAEAQLTAPSDGARAHHGVTFEAWAFVLAGLGDGLLQEELLAHLGITDEHWDLASAAFQDDILDDLEAGGMLTEAFDEAMRAARASWSRPIPPLDTDLRAWLDFYRAWTAAESPMGLLEAHGLRGADIHRLHHHWSDRLAKDEVMQREALTILEGPPGPMPAPKPEPARLREGVTTSGVNATTPAGARPLAAPLPFSNRDVAPPHPRLSVPLPRSKNVAKHVRGEETRSAILDEAGASVLPFSAGRPKSAAVEPSQATSSGSDAFRGDGAGIALSIEHYATLCVDLIESPDAHEAILVRYGISAAEKLALDIYWTQKMAEDSAIWLAWDRASSQHRVCLSTTEI